MSMIRPAPPREAPEGFEWVPAPDADWRVHNGSPCRWMLSQPRRGCKKPSVMALNRGRRSGKPPYERMVSWWPYCEEHTYGRWVENGAVMRWVLRETSENDAEPSHIDGGRP